MTRKCTNWCVLLSPPHRVHSLALAIANLGMLKRCLEEQERKDRGTGDRGGGYLYMGLIIPRLSFLISRPAIVFSIPLFIRHFKNSLIIHKEKTKGITVNSLYSGHCRDLEVVSSLVRVRNSGSLFQSNVCNLFLAGI